MIRSTSESKQANRNASIPVPVWQPTRYCFVVHLPHTCTWSKKINSITTLFRPMYCVLAYLSGMLYCILLRRTQYARCMEGDCFAVRHIPHRHLGMQAFQCLCGSPRVTVSWLTSHTPRMFALLRSALPCFALQNTTCSMYGR